MSSIDSPEAKSSRWQLELLLAMSVSFVLSWTVGCGHHNNKIVLSPNDCVPCRSTLQGIDYPDLLDSSSIDGSQFLSAPPTTLSNFKDLDPWDMTLEECVAMTLANSKVMQKLGGAVVNAPTAATTLYDQALQETSPVLSVESALSAFDAQFNSSLFFNRTEQGGFFGIDAIGNPVLGLIRNTSNIRTEITKRTATGGTIAFRNIVDYTRTIPQFNIFPNTWDTINQFEFRQPLRKGAGTTVNRIAGPNAIPGVYNGVLIARIRSDVTLADFEASVRDLVRDVETNYWELHFAYRNLDTILTSRDSSREIWENRLDRADGGLDRPDDEAQARQNYYNFSTFAQDALVGVLNGQPGVLGAERNLRRLMGLPVQDGRLIRPITEPTVAPVVFDWESSQQQALARRVEIRRQKWTVRGRELELCAAKQLNKWRFDMVGQYGMKGFDSTLYGTGLNGDLRNWQVGFDFGGPIGNRTGHLAIRNAELNLVRARTILREQQRQILHDLGAAVTEVDRARAAMRTNFNSTAAVKEELEPKRLRVREGLETVFFLLDAEQRYATAESSVHRAIADYNQALLNYSWTTGSLLRRFNIVLTEGPWVDAAQIKANVKARRFVNSAPNPDISDNFPVSAGDYDQQSPGPRVIPGIPGQPFQSDFIDPSSDDLDGGQNSIAPGDPNDLDYYSGDDL